MSTAFFLSQCPHQELADCIRCSVDILRETMVEILLHHILTTLPQLVETLSIGIGYYPIGITMDNQCRTVIVCRCLIDR